MNAASIFNRTEIDARTDKAIVDHAKKPHDLPRVGTMVDAFGEKAIIVSTSYAWSVGLHMKDYSRIGLFSNSWQYATPEQRTKVWEGE